MARPETHSGVDEGDEAHGSGISDDQTGVIPPGTGVVRPGTDVVRPGTDVVRPGPDVVRPGTDVVRPGTDVVRPGTTGGGGTDAAKARAVVPDAPERPLDPIHIVLPVIPVMPAKQGFLDRLVAPKSKKDKKSKKEKAASELADEPQSYELESPPEPAPPSPPPAPAWQPPPPEPARLPRPEPPRPDLVRPDLVRPEPGRPDGQPPSYADARLDTQSRPDLLPRPDQGRPDQQRPDQFRPDQQRPDQGRPDQGRPDQGRPDQQRPDQQRPDQQRPDQQRPVAPRQDGRPAGAGPVSPGPSGLTAPGSNHPGSTYAGGAAASPTGLVSPPATPRPTRAPAASRALDGRDQDSRGHDPHAARAAGAPVRPAPARPGPADWDRRRPHRRQAQPAPRTGGDYEVDAYGDDWPDEPELPRRRPIRVGRWMVTAVLAGLLAVGGGWSTGLGTPHAQATWLAGPGAANDSPVLAALGTDGRMPTGPGLASRLQGLLADAKLGHLTGSVVDVASGQSLLDREAAAGATPASTQKLLTAAAVLTARGPAYRIATTAVAGASPGEVVLVGAGDPTLAGSATMSYPGAGRLDLLAKQVIQALGGTAPTHITIDTSLYQGPTFATSWIAEDAKSGFIAQVTALMTDGARQDPKRSDDQQPRFAQPDLAAGQIFARSFGLPPSAVSVATAPAPAGAQRLGTVYSPSVERLVELMLSKSDNMIAEALARQVALAKGQPASFDGGAAATRQVLGEIGLPVDSLSLVDGSGLSHANRVSAGLLTQVLAKAASPDSPRLRPILSGLPVAAYSGTLASRFVRAGAGGAAAGTVRAKTGTLAGVDALAGLVVDADGRLLAFALLANGTPQTFPPPAQPSLDRIAAALAACGC